ncbi:hypothetical protein JNM05_01040 [bacterium]|nr:hypothetical protein [bacterium]
MKRVILALIVTGFFIGCGVARQVQEAKNFAKCTFRIKSVEGTRLGDVKIHNVKSIKDLSFKKAAEITSVLASDEAILSFTLNLQAKNPNAEVAAMNKLEWILFIDEYEMVEGTLNQKVEIPGGQVAEIPIDISTDIKEALKGKSRDAIAKLAFNVAGQGDNPTHILLKVKPSINIAGLTVQYPGYIDVKMEFTAEQGKELRKKVIKESTK